VGPTVFKGKQHALHPIVNGIKKFLSYYKMKLTKLPLLVCFPLTLINQTNETIGLIGGTTWLSTIDITASLTRK